MFKWIQTHPCRPQELIIYDCKGFFFPLLSEPISSGHLLAFFRRTKVLPPQRPPVPSGEALSCPPLSKRGRSQRPLSRHPRPGWSTIPPQLPGNRNSLDLRSRRRGECTGEREQRTRSILSQSHHKRKEGPLAQWTHGEAPSLSPRRQLLGRYCLKESPFIYSSHQGLQLQALARGLPGGGREGKMRGKSSSSTT